jgi:hypothetical protein
MTKVKWRTRLDSPFEFWTDVPDNNLKRYVGPIYPHNSENIRFRITDPIPEDLQEILGRTQEILLLRMSEHFYFIEDKIILVYNPDYPVALLTKENISHFRIGDHDWQPIDNVSFLYQYCIVSLDPKAFSVIGGQYPFIWFTDDNDNQGNELTERSFAELLQQIEIRNYLFT